MEYCVIVFPSKGWRDIIGSTSIGMDGGGDYRSGRRLHRVSGVLASDFPLSESEDGDDDVGVYTYKGREG